jgi:hypothetical protein
LTRALSRDLGPLQLRAGSHDRGRVIRDLAVMLADGGDCLADIAVVRDQATLFGRAASDSTAFRVLDPIASHPEGKVAEITERRHAALGAASQSSPSLRAWWTAAPREVTSSLRKSGRDCVLIVASETPTRAAIS